jgi:opacity protein-like surface antigen
MIHRSIPALRSEQSGFSAPVPTEFSRRKLMSMKMRWSCFVLALVAVIPMHAGAQVKMFEPERVGHWYLSGAVGAFSEETNSQLVNQDGQFGLAISGGYRLTPYVALEIDGLFASQRILTPSTIPGSVLGTPDSRAHLNSGGIGGLVKFILPLDRVELYVGGGLGIYITTLLVEGSLQGAHTELTESDTDIGFQAVAGADFFISRRISVGLEYRRLKLDANLGALIPGDLDMGGDFLFATVRGHF